MIDYSIFSKKPLTPSLLKEEGEWDIFISGFTQATRVQQVFSSVKATKKWWLLLPQYEIHPNQAPISADTYQSDDYEEDAYITAFLAGQSLVGKNICVDITGMLRPHLMFLMRFLADSGLDTIDVLYSEPDYYKKKEKTSFAGEAVVEVRSVRGFEGSPNPTGDELLIVGAGYDAHLLSSICLSKEHAKKILLIGFPSLKPEMYQESLLRISEARESLGVEPDEPGTTYFAPANDPFETALALQRIVERERTAHDENLNIYLCPLATKAQALGFYLFYECELLNSSASIYFPFTRTHSSDTTEGISRVWCYKIEFDTLRTWRKAQV